MSLLTIIIFLIVLAVLIFVHELGHFLFARACGIRVDEFKIGFGPRILHWTRGETQYGLNLVPFGGYVKIFGENPDEVSLSGPDASRSFVNKPRIKQALVLVAGILFNFIFAWLLYIGVFATGVTVPSDAFPEYANYFENERIQITAVNAGSPAALAGIKGGDILVGVNSAKDVQSFVSSTEPGSNKVSVANIQNAINQSKGSTLVVYFVRDGQDKIAIVTPKQGIIANKYAIGIAMSEVVDFHLPFFTSIWQGFRYTLTTIKETAVGLYSFIANIFHGTANFSDVAGPVGIAGIVGDAAHAGFNYLLIITSYFTKDREYRECSRFYPTYVPYGRRDL